MRSEVRVVVTATAGGDTRTAEIRLRIVPLPSLPTLFSFTSPAGEIIGRGQSRRFTTSDAYFSAKALCGPRFIVVNIKTGNANEWNIRMEAPRGRLLTTGTYENAREWPFQPRDQPGLFVSDTGGCSDMYGGFVVTHAIFNSDGTIRRFRATFEQRCGSPTAPALVGEISLSDPPLYNLQHGCL